jgi:hypothetical protein
MTINDTMRVLFDPMASLQERLNALHVVRGSDIPISEKSEVLRRLLNDDHRDMRLCAATIADKMADAASMAFLWSMLDFTDDELAYAILKSLGRMVGPDIVPTCARLLVHGSDIQQSNALEVLEQVACDSATDVIRQALQTHPNSYIRFRAAVHLACHGDRSGMDVLLSYVADGHWVYRTVAAFALTKIDAEAGYESLSSTLYSVLDEGQRNYLVLIFRGMLGLSNQTDEEVMNAARSWIAQRLRL